MSSTGFVAASGSNIGLLNSLIEFVITTEEGSVVPIEVKSGTRSRAKSLQSYITKCARHNIVMPLYYAEYIFGRI